MYTDGDSPNKDVKLGDEKTGSLCHSNDADLIYVFLHGPSIYDTVKLNLHYNLSLIGKWLSNYSHGGITSKYQIIKITKELLK